MATRSTILNTPNIARREWWLAGVVAALAVAISMVPMLLGALRTPVGRTYLYTNIPDVNDSQVYYAFIDQNAQGHVLYRNLFTGEAHRAVLFDPLWTVLGAVEALSQQKPAVVFLESCAIFGFGLVMMIYLCICHFFTSARWRMGCLLLTIFGGGFGGLTLLFLHPGSKLVFLYTQPSVLHNLSIDLTQPAGFTWMTLSHAPHYILAQVLLLFVWLTMWRRWRIGWAVLATGLLGFIHPYDLVLLFGVLMVHFIFSIQVSSLTPEEFRTYLKPFGWLLLGTVPSVIYYVWAITSEPVIRQWFTQNILLAPTPLALVLGYGVILPLAVLGARRILRDRDQQGLAVVSWAAASLVLLYLPLVSFEAKMMAGLNIPLAILAMLALQQILTRVVRPRPRRWAWVGIGLAAVITFSTVSIWPSRLIASQQSEPNYHYASNDLVTALKWIKTSTPTSSVILGDMSTGNIVPQFTSRQTYLGHNVQTIHFSYKLALVRRWFYGTSGDVRDKSQFLRDQHIGYVVWGPAEKSEGPFDPAELSDLTLVYRQGDVSVYRRQ